MENKKWYKKLKKAPLSPPDWIFGTVWPILYLMLGVSCALIWNDPKCAPYCKQLNPFWIQLVLNLCWTTVFFKYKQIFGGLLMILAILYYTYITYIKFLEINPIASYLLVPYMLWLCFAAYLNGYILFLN